MDYPIEQIARDSLFAHNIRTFMGQNYGFVCDSVHGPITSSALTGPEAIFKLHTHNLRRLRRGDLDDDSPSSHSQEEEDPEIWDWRIPTSYVTDMQRQLLRSKVKCSKERLESGLVQEDSTFYKEELSYMQELQRLEQALPQTQQSADHLQELRDRQQQSWRIKRQRKVQEDKRKLAETLRKLSRRNLLNKHRREREELAMGHKSEKDRMERRIKRLQRALDCSSDPHIQSKLTQKQSKLAEMKKKHRETEKKLSLSQRKEMDEILIYPKRSGEKKNKRVDQLEGHDIWEVVETEWNLRTVTPELAQEKFDNLQLDLSDMIPGALAKRRQYSAAFDDIYLSALSPKPSSNFHDNSYSNEGAEEISLSLLSPKSSNNFLDDLSEAAEEISLSLLSPKSPNNFLDDLSEAAEEISLSLLSPKYSNYCHNFEEDMEDETLMIQPTHDSKQTSIYQKSDQCKVSQSITDKASPSAIFTCYLCEAGADNIMTGDVECLCKSLVDKPLWGVQFKYVF